jgi:alpha-glucuronidase
MWFHHVPWDRRLRSGRIFWDELVYRYQTGVHYVSWMRQAWDSLEPWLDARRFAEVKAKLAAHETDAGTWRDTCVQYWQQFSGRAVPTDGPLAIRIEVGGRTIGGFDAGAPSVTIPVAPGTSPKITKVVPGSPAARWAILSQARGVPGRAVVRVTAMSFFGPILKDYVFDFTS